jgi:hypothetical protein
MNAKHPMRDFILQTFKFLCTEFQKRGYRFITFADYCGDNIPEKFVIVRHDVDRNPENALKMAIFESRLKIRASYYFRRIKESYKPSIIREIAGMGHEVGYHYEDLSLSKGDFEQAIEMFTNNLRNFRQLYPVKTICMHGSPSSKWDNRLIWQQYDYRDFGIIGEPFFDVDFNRVLYLTDTGRRWNGADVSIRDKVKSKYKYNFKSTRDILQTLNKDELPNRIMINIHPQRWNDKLLPWLKELVWQNAKNIVKKYFFVK